jgi:hypothetical protein
MSETLAVRRAHELAQEATQPRWLVEALWSEQAVGILGGQPKCCKSFLALEIAVAVASGSPCLRRFAVPHPGRVLLFAAEDQPQVLRQRLAGIAWAAACELADLDVYVITDPVLRLDRRAHRARLEQTVQVWRPRLLILDPFVRLHEGDENAVADVAPLLAYLRGLQRRYACAVLLVHHARKGGGGSRHGQALRGSSELHAWGDSNLYLYRRGDLLRLAVEHRAAAAPDDLFLRLQASGDALTLALDEGAADQDHAADSTGPDQRIEAALAAADQPLTLRQLRAHSRMRMQTLCAHLRALSQAGRITKLGAGYQLADPSVSPATRGSRGSGNGKPQREAPGETEVGSAEAQPAEG